MKRTLVTVLISVCVCICFRSAHAQTATPPSPTVSTPTPQAAAPVKDPVATSLRMLLPRSRSNILGAIGAMPADKFNYKPTPDQMSFAHLVVHIISSNHADCTKAASIAAPKARKSKKPIPKIS